MKQETARAIIFWEEDGEAGYFNEVTEREIVDQRRWVTCFSQVFQDTRNNTFWRLDWERGSTESQEGSDEVYITEVEPKEVTKIEYVAKGK